MAGLLDDRMFDGSRHFAMLPQTVLWYGVRDHAGKLLGAVITEFVCDGITEAWLYFSYRHHEFSVNDQFGDYWFFVADPACPEPILREVLDHFAQLLDQSKK